MTGLSTGEPVITQSLHHGRLPAFMVSKVLRCALSPRRFGARSGAALYALQRPLVEMARDCRIDHQMPTDVDRYEHLLQNLAVGIGAIREAIEQAFGVTLPTAPRLNAEFEIITSAIYAAADQPRPVPLTDNKPTTRTQFVYRIDIWTDDGKNILEHLAGMENLIVARAAYRAACERWPNARITLRQGARVVEDSRCGIKA